MYIHLPAIDRLECSLSARLIMETADDDEDPKLGQASASLLSALESALPKLLWRRPKTGGDHGPVHTRAKRRDLDYVIKLVRP